MIICSYIESLTFPWATSLAVRGVCFLRVCEGPGCAAEGGRDRCVSVWSKLTEMLEMWSAAARPFTARFTGH